MMRPLPQARAAGLSGVLAPTEDLCGFGLSYQELGFHLEDS
jgi:hypothetical protein